MQTRFALPPGVLGRFAIVKLWPEIKAAEDECIARIKSAANLLGIDCFEILESGHPVDQSGKPISRGDVDFVLHLHYDTPKLYDAFSFVALWNPVPFYHQWGYQRTSRNIASHDDFISCSSDAADDHVARLIRNSGTQLPALFHLYHSTSGIAHLPSIGDGILFYAGINWEALGGGQSRHQELLKILDSSNRLRIYGPKLFRGVRVWKGYKSYVREIPFDGVSLIDEISRAGIALVISSAAHKESELMSNRLFESIAAGAVVICDDNPFAERYFGSTLLYFDGRASAQQASNEILAHLEWVRGHPREAKDMVDKAQRIFQENFTLTGNLRIIYEGLNARKQQLKERQNPTGSKQLRVRACYLMPKFTEAVLDRHLKSICAQNYGLIDSMLVIDTEEFKANRDVIEDRLAKGQTAVRVKAIDFAERNRSTNGRPRRRLGAVLYEMLDQARDADALIVVGPNERLFSNHVAVLAGALQRDPTLNCAATAAAILNDKGSTREVHDSLDFSRSAPEQPIGYGRFIFRSSSLPSDIGIALPHLDHKAIAALVGEKKISQQLSITLLIHPQEESPAFQVDEIVENQIICDYCPGAFAHAPDPLIAPVPKQTASKKPRPLKRIRRQLRARVASLFMARNAAR